MAVNTWERVEMAKYHAYRWRVELNTAQKALLALGMAVALGLMAQARVYLPWTPVPITMQTLGVLLAGVMLGRNWGAASALLYVGLGACGVPWFNGWSGGMAHLAGPTGGYLIGFVLAAGVVGYVSDKYAKVRTLPRLLGLMTLAGILLVYLPGLLWLKLWTGLLGSSLGWGEVLAMGVLPFIAGDLLKVIAAAALARAVLPRRA